MIRRPSTFAALGVILAPLLVLSSPRGAVAGGIDWVDKSTALKLLHSGKGLGVDNPHDLGRYYTVVFLPDGYTRNQERLFEDAAERAARALVKTRPFFTYGAGVRVLLCKAWSKSDHVSTDKGAADTAFNTGMTVIDLLPTLQGGWARRDPSLKREAQAHLDEVRQLVEQQGPSARVSAFVVIAHTEDSSFVGGSSIIGSRKAVINHNPASLDFIPAHELGHATALLYDEYQYDIKLRRPWNVRDQDGNVIEPPFPNTSFQVLKWALWVNPPSDWRVGAYLGAGEFSNLLRPVPDYCRMGKANSQRGRDYCPICKQEMMGAIWEEGLPIMEARITGPGATLQEPACQVSDRRVVMQHGTMVLIHYKDQGTDPLWTARLELAIPSINLEFGAVEVGLYGPHAQPKPISWKRQVRQEGDYTVTTFTSDIRPVDLPAPGEPFFLIWHIVNADKVSVKIGPNREPLHTRCVLGYLMRWEIERPPAQGTIDPWAVFRRGGNSDTCYADPETRLTPCQEQEIRTRAAPLINVNSKVKVEDRVRLRTDWTHEFLQRNWMSDPAPGGSGPTWEAPDPDLVLEQRPGGLDSRK